MNSLTPLLRFRDDGFDLSTEQIFLYDEEFRTAKIAEIVFLNTCWDKNNHPRMQYKNLVEGLAPHVVMPELHGNKIKLFAYLNLANIVYTPGDLAYYVSTFPTDPDKAKKYIQDKGNDVMKMKEFHKMISSIIEDITYKTHLALWQSEPYVRKYDFAQMAALKSKFTFVKITGCVCHRCHKTANIVVFKDDIDWKCNYCGEENPHSVQLDKPYPMPDMGPLVLG